MTVDLEAFEPPAREHRFTREEKNELTPEVFVAVLKSRGFLFESDRCPVKIKKPWRAEEDFMGGVTFRQWVAQ